MSEVIGFLEQMGQSAALRHATKPTLYKALNAQGVDQTAQWSIMSGDVARLSAMLSAQTEMMCQLFAAEEDVAEVALQNVRQAA